MHKSRFRNAPYFDVVLERDGVLDVTIVLT